MCEFSFTMNHTITKGERDDALDQWAVDNNLFEAYQNYRTKTESAREERQKAILNTLDYVRGFFEKVEEFQRRERDDALDQWAVDNNLFEAYQNYRTSTESAREERQKAILNTLDYVRGFFEKVEEFQRSKSYTCSQEADGIRELCSTLSVLERQLVNNLLFAYRTEPSGRFKKSLAFAFADTNLLG
ncbi:unnamed protein product [Strongylus vulgaris]|uniref:SXP/RAL-2 family protein Ani s 5-like cation-binding domain-containing protein n=1 Tax=Strongylus vulgaris TaxID=40348 RepID=A0A3P7JQF7_STRVU|nr:unnamed protein product [Strongylus vulgaris]